MDGQRYSKRSRAASHTAHSPSLVDKCVDDDETDDESSSEEDSSEEEEETQLRDKVTALRVEGSSDEDDEESISRGEEELDPRDLIDYTTLRSDTFRSHSYCLAKTGDGPWVGSLDPRNQDLRIRFCLTAGHLGDPKLVLKIHSLKREPLTVDTNSTKYHEMTVEACPGLIGDENTGNFQIEDFAYSKVDVDQENERVPTHLISDPSNNKDLIYVTFSLHGACIRGWEYRDDAEKMADKPSIEFIDSLCKTVCLVKILFLTKGPKDSWSGEHFDDFETALRLRPPPLNQYFSNGNPDVDVGMDDVHEFRKGMYIERAQQHGFEDEDEFSDDDFMNDDLMLHDRLSVTLPVVIPLPFRRHFTSLEEVQVLYGAGLVREYQHINKIDLEMDEVFQTLQIKPIMPTDSEEAFKYAFHGHIRLSYFQGAKSFIPLEGRTVTITVAGTEKTSDDKWIGKVCKTSREDLLPNAAHFGVFITGSPSLADLDLGSSETTSNDSSELAGQTGTESLTVHLQWHNWRWCPDRELEALEEFANPDRHDLLPLKHAIVGTPTRQILARADLRAGPCGDKRLIHKWEAAVNDLVIKKDLDPRQSSIFNGIVYNKLQLIKSPPGTADHAGIPDLVGLLTTVGHRVLVTCPIEEMIDPVSSTIFSTLQLLHDTRWPGSEYKKLLTYDSFATEMPYLDTRDNRFTWDDLSTDILSYRLLFHSCQEILAEQDKLKEAEDRIREVTSMEIGPKLDGKIKTSMGWRVRSLLEEDKNLPEYPWKAYVELLDWLRGAHDFRVSRKSLNKLQRERLKVVRRVIGESDVIITTCNGAGSSLIKSSFKPTVVMIKSSGLASVPAALAVLTHQSYQAAYLFGDPKSEQPKLRSGYQKRVLNEACINFGTSLFEMLLEKGIFGVIELHTQTRMAPAISSFLAKSILLYQGQFRDSNCANADNPIRKAVRRLSQQQYGVGGAGNVGSEYFMVDVRNGVSRRGMKGSSYENSTNVAAVLQLAQELIQEGIPGSKITVVVYFYSQLRLYHNEIQDIQLKHPDFAIDVRPVATLAGQINNVVLVDTVKGLVEDEEGNIGWTKPSSRLRDLERLVTALSGARDGLVFFGNLKALCSKDMTRIKDFVTEESGSRRVRNSREPLIALIKNALQRKLIHSCYTVGPTTSGLRDLESKISQFSHRALLDWRKALPGTQILAPTTTAERLGNPLLDRSCLYRSGDEALRSAPKAIADLVEKHSLGELPSEWLGGFPSSPEVGERKVEVAAPLKEGVFERNPKGKKGNDGKLAKVAPKSIESKNRDSRGARFKGKQPKRSPEVAVGQMESFEMKFENQDPRTTCLWQSSSYHVAQPRPTKAPLLKESPPLESWEDWEDSDDEGKRSQG